MNRRLVRLSITWVLSVMLMPAIAQTQYAMRLVDVDAPDFVCYDINDSGEVAGDGFTQFGAPHFGFVWHDGATTRLADPPVANVRVGSIDNSGRVYGTYLLNASASIRRRVPIRWINRQPEPLPDSYSDVLCFVETSPSGDYILLSTQPYDGGTPGWRNQNGWVQEADFTADSEDPLRDFVITAKGRLATGVFPGAVDGHLADINDSGQAAGVADIGGRYYNQAAGWDPARGYFLLGTLGGRASVASAINNRGQIAGWSYAVAPDGTGPIKKPFVWESGVMRDLGVVPGFRQAHEISMNDDGVVIGTLNATEEEYGWDGVFLWKDGVLSDLGDLVPAPLPGFTIRRAVAINNAGQIVVGENPNHFGGRFALLTPVP